MFFKLVSEILQLYITIGLIHIKCCFVIDFIVYIGPEHHSKLSYKLSTVLFPYPNTLSLCIKNMFYLSG